MNVLFILGSPRKVGNSEILADRVIKGVEEAGAVSEKIRLSDLKISPCIACGGCEKTGKCVILDDMQALYDKIDSVNRIVIVSPIYFYGVTAFTKSFIDRSQAMWSRKYLLNERVAGEIPRKGYFVSVCATKGERIFEGAVLTVKYGLDAMDFSYGGDLLVRGVDSKGEITGRSDELEQARDFGRKIVTD